MKIKALLKIFILLLFSLVVLAGYFYLSFLAGGHDILAGARGTDSWAYISHLKLLADNFPKIPFWNNLEGAGISLTHSYPNLTHLIIIVTSKLTSLSISESFKLWGFLGVTLFAFGVFVYTWSRLKIVVVAVLAGIFVLISPITWIWWFEWGFIAEVISAMFFPYTILFADLFINRILEKKFDFKTRFYFVLTVIFLSLSFLAHPVIFIGAASLMVIYIFLLTLLRKKGRLKAVSIAAKYGILLFLCFLGLSWFWLLPFNRYQKLAAQSRPQSFVTVESYERDIIPLEYLLSFDRPQVMEKEKYFQKYDQLKPGDELVEKYRGGDKDYVVQKGIDRANFSFPYAVSLLYFLGLVTGFIFWRRKSIPLFLTSPIGLLIFTSATALFYAGKLPGPLSRLTSRRALIYINRLLVPMIAGTGVYGLFALFFYPFRFIDRFLILRFFKNAILTLASLGLALLVLYQFRSKPVDLPYDANYGREKIDLQDFWGVEPGVYCHPGQSREQLQCQSKKLNLHFKGYAIAKLCTDIEVNMTAVLPAVCKDNFTDEDVDQLVKECDSNEQSEAIKILCQARHELWSELISDLGWGKIASQLNHFPQQEFSLAEYVKEYKDYFALIPDDLFVRYDNSPSGTIMCQQGPFAKAAPQMCLYGANLSLINRFYGYQISNFYTGDKVYNDPAALPEISQWFGIKNIIIQGKFDETNQYFEKLTQAGFEIANSFKNQKGINSASLLEFPKGEPIMAVARKPKILVIGSEAKRAYEAVFIKAHFGLVSYNEAILLHGKENIDDYNLEQLKDYDVLFLYGYQYKNRKRAWRLLDQYLKQGGRLFIDTGWENVAADWESEQTANFFPTTLLEWTDFGKSKDFQLIEGLVDIKDIDVFGFEPLIWKDTPWKVSSADTLRDWAKPILTVGNHPLIAGGQYGEGRVIWSGMNLISHISVFNHQHPEMILAGRLIDWLLEGKEVVNFTFNKDFTASRENPDKAEFIFNTNIDSPVSLYFKEAYYPYWQAELSQNSKLKAQSLRIERAGPNFMFVQLPDIKAGDKVSLVIKRPMSDYLAYLISTITLIGLLLYLIKPGIFKINAKLSSKLKFKNIASWWNKDEY
ncbi:hypothetical protein ACFLZ1_02290 [Patescibacteria group bacterium]